ncbi:S-adenosyl-L-methionine-dependent methyltransferase [Mycena albidolilacea]|uniref:S-adenosyl-L-methionine-dependent methyltransferase n=1 Tax=Mycena albidolilacea TaxID=1033008 RepID=A0AAD6ZA06_9AGAR|nr:S-adenosyl-L-methionine-dependent methyltransferase [Mycena albidolilacea]
MASEITQLSAIIQSSVQDLLALSSTNGWSLPELNKPFDPATQTFRADPDGARASAKIIAAAMQLATTLMSPKQSIVNTCVQGPLKGAALRVCLGSHVPEILREAGPEGLHVKKITERTGSRIDSAKKIARLLRFLANSHLFREVKPDVFAHTMNSSVLDVRKPVDEILANPSAKHDGTPGFVALWEYTLDEAAKSSSMLLENMTDPRTAFSDDPILSPHQRVFNHNLSTYDWYELPENDYRRRRFSTGQTGFVALAGSSILREYDWNALPKGSVVVDVGGGFGASAKYIAQHAPHLQVIVQDKQEVVAAGRQAWKERDLLESKRVVFQGHDFFTPQPDNKAAVFVLKNILHNWGDSYNVCLLKHLRAAATPETRILIVGAIIQHVCPSDGSTSDSGPLLPTYGVLSQAQFMLDIMMLVNFNAREYTQSALAELLLQGGWKICAVHERDDIFVETTGLELVVASPI